MMVTEVILASFDNRLDEARKLLDEAKAAHPADLKYLETIVRGWATLASEGLRHKSPKAAELATEAIAHLEAALERGVKPTESLLIAFDDIRDHPRLVALVGKAGLDDRYAALWLSIEGMGSTEIHGLEPAMHQARGRELAKLGYRVAGISAFHPEEKGAVVVSAWQRPTLKEPDRLRDAERRALAAVALAAGRAGTRVGPAPQRAGPERCDGLDPRPGPRRGLSRADPGEAPGRTPGRRPPFLAAGARGMRPNRPSSGRSASGQRPWPWPSSRRPRPRCPLRRRMAGEDARGRPRGRGVAKSLASPVTTGPRGWYVNGQGQTFAVIRGPVKFTGGAGQRRRPVHPRRGQPAPRRIPRTFAMATKEVTNAEFRRFLDETPTSRTATSWPTAWSPTRPVFNVSWRNSARYCRWLTARKGSPRTSNPTRSFHRPRAGRRVDRPKTRLSPPRRLSPAHRGRVGIHGQGRLDNAPLLRRSPRAAQALRVVLRPPIAPGLADPPRRPAPP